MFGKKDSRMELRPDKQRMDGFLFGKADWAGSAAADQEASSGAGTPSCPLVPSPVAVSRGSSRTPTAPIVAVAQEVAAVAKADEQEWEEQEEKRDVVHPMPAAVGDAASEQPQDNTPGLKLVFVTGRGQQKEVVIANRPLGAEFSKRPFNMTKVSKVTSGSHAWALGLEVGWAVKQVDGVDVTKKTFNDTQMAIKKGMESLPFLPSS